MSYTTLSKKNNPYLLLLFMLTNTLFAQVGIGTVSPESSSIVDISSTEAGMLPPRMNTTQRDAIHAPAEGLTIYNLETHCLEWFNGTQWYSPCSASNNNNTPKIIEIAYYGNFSIGEFQQTRFNNQLQDPANYGLSGTYDGILGFNFTDITNTITSTTAADLVNNYDMIVTGYAPNISTQVATRVRDFVDLGGVAMILLDRNRHTTIHQAFGGSGTVGAGQGTCLTNGNNLNSGIFGNVSNIELKGEGSYGQITTPQLPADATVLASNGSNPYVWITGTEGRALFFWDEGVFRDPIVANAINTPQEIWLHNMMAYALEKLGC
jgi:hypothetical protein